jgi:hypothetical protein
MAGVSVEVNLGRRSGVGTMVLREVMGQSPGRGLSNTPCVPGVLEGNNRCPNLMTVSAMGFTRTRPWSRFRTHVAETLMVGFCVKPIPDSLAWSIKPATTPSRLVLCSISSCSVSLAPRPSDPSASLTKIGLASPTRSLLCSSSFVDFALQLATLRTRNVGVVPRAMRTFHSSGSGRALRKGYSEKSFCLCPTGGAFRDVIADRGRWSASIVF